MRRLLNPLSVSPQKTGPHTRAQPARAACGAAETQRKDWEFNPVIATPLPLFKSGGTTHHDKHRPKNKQLQKKDRRYKTNSTYTTYTYFNTLQTTQPYNQTIILKPTPYSQYTLTVIQQTSITAPEGEQTTKGKRT